MKDASTPRNHKKAVVIGILSISLILSLAVVSLPSRKAADAQVVAKNRAALALPAVNNPAPPSDMCQNLQVLVLVDRSGSVTNEGSATVQKYKDQVKKVWHTLHNISKTYGGYTSGYLWAFGGRTADQMPRLLAKDNNKDGVVNDGDRDLGNIDVLSGYDTMTQDIYFRNDNGAQFPANQTASYGYNPDSETHSKLIEQLNGTNWHDSFLMAQKTISAANAPGNAARDYNMVIIITDGVPTLDDGANMLRDPYMKNKTIDENFDGNDSTTSHATRTKTVVDSLRSGKLATSNTVSFTPVQVHGILIGGGNSGATRMTNTFGTGNWFQSSNFDTTLGAQLLSVVGQTCPPAPTLTAGMTATIVGAPTNVIEDSDVIYTVDVTNTGQALLENLTVSNGTVVSLPADPSYTSSGMLSPGKKRRFQITQHVGGGSRSATVTIPYSAHVAEDPSVLVPGTVMNITGQLSAGLVVNLVPRPA